MILDTNALSAVADADPAVWPLFSQAGVVGIPVIVLGEYRFGISRSRRQSFYDSWLEKHLPSCLVLDVSEETSTHYAVIRTELRSQGTPIPANDAWIAALSRQHRMPILSRDRHFDAVSGVRRVSW